jgi:hypothetical protein
MSGAIGGNSKHGGVSAPIIAGLQVSTSTYGLPIPIVWGQNRMQGNLLWYGNFSANAASSGGGKGGGGSTPSSYNYTAAGLTGLCEGGGSGIGGIAQVWNSKNATTLAALNITLNTGTYPQTPWGYLTTNFPTQAIGYPGVANVCSPNFQLSTTAQMPNVLYEVQGLNRYGSTGQTGLACSFSGTAFTTTAAHNFTANQSVQFTTSGTLPSGVLASTDYYVIPTGAYTFTLYPTPYQAAATSGNPNAIQPSGGAGTLTVTPFIQGANPADVLTSFITDPVFGVNSYGNASQIPLFGLYSGSASFSNYCVANGIFVSPALTRQLQASDFITKLCDIANSAPVWSQGVLKIIPYGDTAVSGNGVTYTPSATVQFRFTDDDYLDDGTNDPVAVTRSNPADAYNQVQVGFLDRTHQYDPNVAQAQDQANIDLYGLRPMPLIQHDFITDAQVARNVAQAKLQRVLYTRNRYAFKVGWKYAQLEPMDLISLTDAALGLNGLVVRVIQVEEDSEEQLAIVAEDYLVNNATVQAVAPPAVGGATAMMNMDPGPCNAPVIFDAPGILTNSGFELWMAVSGGRNWGGCQVWVSLDNATYQYVGSQNGGARYGVMNSGILAGSDPDTTDVFSVDLSVSGGTLSSGSTTDADSLSTLCLIDDTALGQPELIAYSNATLLAENQYEISTYFRRGVYNTTNGPHYAGPFVPPIPFVRLDGSIFKYAYDPSWVGKTVYVKLVPFNLYGAGDYTLAMVNPVAYTIKGSISHPSNVQNFCVAQQDALTMFTWQDVPGPLAYIAGYEIRYSAQTNSSWANAAVVTKATNGTQTTTARVAPGAWNFFIAAVDICGNYSPAPTVIAATITSNVVLAQQSMGPDWDWSAPWVGPGHSIRPFISGMFHHWTGVLYPLSQTLACNTGGTTPANDALWNEFVPNPVTVSDYTAAYYLSGQAGTYRLSVTVDAYIPPTSFGLPDVQVSVEGGHIQGSLFIGTGGGYNWTAGTLSQAPLLRQLGFGMDLSDGVPCIRNLNIIMDAPIATQTGTATVATGGTNITFPFPFNLPPLVTAQDVYNGTTLKQAVVNSAGAGGFTASDFTLSGTDAGGTINWTATGA